MVGIARGGIAGRLAVIGLIGLLVAGTIPAEAGHQKVGDTIPLPGHFGYPCTSHPGCASFVARGCQSLPGDESNPFVNIRNVQSYTSSARTGVLKLEGAGGIGARHWIYLSFRGAACQELWNAERDGIPRWFLSVGATSSLVVPKGTVWLLAYTSVPTEFVEFNVAWSLTLQH